MVQIIGENQIADSDNLYSCSALSEGHILLPGTVIKSLPAAERLRIVRAKIERANIKEKKLTTLVITSALPREGKSVIAANLSRSLGLDPMGKTILVDCDLRKPSVHKFFDYKVYPGLSDVILGQASLGDVIRNVSSGLDVLTAGTPTFDPTQTVEQPALEVILNELKKHYRYVIIDAPPVLLCPEPITLANLADSTILVVRAWKTEKKLIQDAIQAVGKQKFFGVVFNDANESSRQYGYYSYYGYKRVPVSNGTPGSNASFELVRADNEKKGLLQSAKNSLKSLKRFKRDSDGLEE